MNRNLTGEELVAAQQWRYAVKKFDATKKLSSEQWTALEQSLVLTPSSFGLQPWRFIIVQNPAVRKQLTPASWGQTQVEDCSHYVVFAARNGFNQGDIDAHVNQIAKTRGVTAESLDGYRKMMVGSLLSRSASDLTNWTTKQCYIALGNLMTSAAVLGVDVCPMEGIEPAKYDEILGVSKLGGYSCVVAAAVGFRAADDGYAKAPKVRFGSEQVLVRI